MNYEELVTCPYNKFHQIKKSRIQYHILKCKKSHPELELVICPYNATHHFPKSEEREHLLSCRDRRVVEMQKYNDPLPGRHGYLANPPFYGSTLVEAATASNRESVGNQSQQAPSLNDTDSISTTDRHIDLRGRINPRREPSPNYGPPYRTNLETASSSAGAEAMGHLTPTRFPLRRSGTSTPERENFYGGPPPISTSARLSRMRRLSGESDSSVSYTGRKTSPGSGSGLSSGVYPSSATTRKTSPSPSRHGVPGSESGLSSGAYPGAYQYQATSRKTSPSPSRHGLPVSLTTEGGRLVPRRRSQSPSNSSISDYKSYKSN